MLSKIPFGLWFLAIVLILPVSLLVYTSNMRYINIDVISVKLPTGANIFVAEEATPQESTFIPIASIGEKFKKIPECSVVAPANTMTTSITVKADNSVIFYGVFPARALFPSTYRQKIFDMINCVGTVIASSKKWD
jgi:hypothetical protein